MADDMPNDDIESWLRALWEFFDGPAGTAVNPPESAGADTPAGTRWDAR